MRNQFPKKKWEEMTLEEQDHFRRMSEDALVSRWGTIEGQEIKRRIIAANLNDSGTADYSGCLGTVKADWGQTPPKTDLRGIDLSEFSNTIDDTIYGFDFSACLLHFSDFSGCILTSSSFKRSDILYSNFSQAKLDECDFSATNLTLSDFSGSDLEQSDLRGAWITDVSFDGANLGFVKFDRHTDFRNIDISTVRGSSNPLFTSFVRRTHYLKHFREQNLTNKAIYYVWLLISDCGQSFSRWFGVSILISAVFGYIYSRIPGSFFIANDRSPTPFTFCYYSVVAFTTLGFGDVIPRDLLAEALVTLEVILGYLMLGGLISIFATKFIPKE